VHLPRRTATQAQGGEEGKRGGMEGAVAAASTAGGGGGGTAAPTDAVLAEVNGIIEKLLAVRGTRQSSNMQVGGKEGGRRGGRGGGKDGGWTLSFKFCTKMRRKGGRVG